MRERSHRASSVPEYIHHDKMSALLHDQSNSSLDEMHHQGVTKANLDKWSTYQSFIILRNMITVASNRYNDTLSQQGDTTE